MQVRLRDKSGIRLYRYLVEDVDRDGNVRIYFRRRGERKIRLKEVPGTPAFDAEYKRAFSGEALPVSPSRHGAAMPGTMRWLCEQYYASAKFQSLAPSTRKTPFLDANMRHMVARIVPRATRLTMPTHALRSHLSLARASETVCHCRLETASSTAVQRGRQALEAIHYLSVAATRTKSFACTGSGGRV